ncbi:unnamed protein product [Vitrella brassicaformis CCMP3155]|uniref:Uncharacterized protein n=1 Tax=Vitrella brassicaformis (strain CCMP3155) TaxID=1169540 RepID=A0A0G4FT34_VITBC|nr:unnamed protein product [Vitrella brassicaformis CCMP3155]|eukprot:CEM17842.1 unnamed protein product [Vitrella brassicaformis CCMP3155]
MHSPDRYLFPLPKVREAEPSNAELLVASCFFVGVLTVFFYWLECWRIPHLMGCKKRHNKRRTQHAAMIKKQQAVSRQQQHQALVSARQLMREEEAAKAAEEKDEKDKASRPPRLLLLLEQLVREQLEGGRHKKKVKPASRAFVPIDKSKVSVSAFRYVEVSVTVKKKKQSPTDPQPDHHSEQASTGTHTPTAAEAVEPLPVRVSPSLSPLRHPSSCGFPSPLRPPSPCADGFPSPLRPPSPCRDKKASSACVGTQPALQLGEGNNGGVDKQKETPKSRFAGWSKLWSLQPMSQLSYGEFPPLNVNAPAPSPATSDPSSMCVEEAMGAMGNKGHTSEDNDMGDNHNPTQLPCLVCGGKYGEGVVRFIAGVMPKEAAFCRHCYQQVKDGQHSESISSMRRRG